MNNTLFLNFFSDSVKWENLILCPAYPVGMSYHRAFRYRNEWIYNPLLEKIKMGSFDYSSAIISACFLGKEKMSEVLPIRKINNIHLERSWNNRYYFYFTFGEMVDFNDYEKLEDLIISLPEYKQFNDRKDPFLLIESQINLEHINFTNGSDENELSSWDKYCELISNDNKIPIDDKAKRSMFLRISGIKPIKKLSCSKRIGSKYGLLLGEGKNNEFCIDHQIPYLFNKNMDLPKLNYKFDVSSTDIQLNTLYEEFSGNYQSHNLMVTGLHKSSAYSTIHLKSTQGELIEFNNDKIYLHDLKIPVKVKFNFIYRFTNQWFLVILFLIGLILIDCDSIFNLSNNCSPLIIVLGTLLTTIAFALYKDRL